MQLLQTHTIKAYFKIVINFFCSLNFPKFPVFNAIQWLQIAASAPLHCLQYYTSPYSPEYHSLTLLVTVSLQLNFKTLHYIRYLCQGSVSSQTLNESASSTLDPENMWLIKFEVTQNNSQKITARHGGHSLKLSQSGNQLETNDEIYKFTSHLSRNFLLSSNFRKFSPIH